MTQFAARRFRRTSLETLEPRAVLSHNATELVPFEMPASLRQSLAEDMAASGAAATIYPGEAVVYDTLANGMPILHSLPSAPAAIFLDFDGGIYHWNESLPAYDTDGNPAVFGLNEQLAIYECWRQVSTYFAMFNVDVTTIDSARPKAWLLPTAGGSSGGSFVNAFPNVTAESKTGIGAVTTRSSVFAHEIGHNFGTWHTGDFNELGVQTAEYHTEFDPLHGPIMGIDYSGVIHKWTWWHSPNDGPTLLQNDMQIIADDLDNDGGDGYRPDDFGSAMNAGTTALTAFGVTQSRVGIIERLTDSDAFAFTSTGGRYAIVAGRDAPSGVDLKLSIYNAAGQLLATEDGDPRAVPYSIVNDQHLTLDLPAGTYYAVVESHGNYGDQGQYILRVDPVPAGWNAEDIGLVGVPGYSSYDSATGTYTVTGSGSDIWSSADGFQFLYQTLDGDGTIVARVASLENTNSDAKAGVMIRESLAENSKNAMLEIKPGNTTHFQRRTSTGGSSSSTSGPSGSTWRWMRLTRASNTITAAVSTNGTSWTNVGSQTVTMGARVLIGLATTARNNVALNSAVYTDVALSGNLNPESALNELPAIATLAATAFTSDTIALLWNAAGDVNGDGSVDSADLNVVKQNLAIPLNGETRGDANGDGRVDLDDYNLVRAAIGSPPPAYVVEQSPDGTNFAPIGATATGATAFLVTGLTDFQRYFFRVRSLGSAGTLSRPSVVASAQTMAGAVTNVTTMSVSVSQIVIDWRDAGGEANYRVQRWDNVLGDWINRGGLLAKNTPSFTDTGAVGTTYYYRVLTLNEAGHAVATSGVVVESTRLSPVAGLAFSNLAANQAAIAWNPLAGATGYRVERSVNGTLYSVVAANVTFSSYVDNTVAAGTRYYYRVIGLKSGLTESATPTIVISGTMPVAAAASGPAASKLPASAAPKPATGEGNRAAGASATEKANSIVQLAVRKLKNDAQVAKLSKRQRAAVEQVLANWNFERSDRALSKALLAALGRMSATTPGLSLRLHVGESLRDSR